MARLAATAVLLLCLLTVASCRVLEPETETAVAISDELIQADLAVPHETDCVEAIPSLPTVTVVDAILRLPSHRRPCSRGEARVFLAVLPKEPREAVVEVEAVAEPDPDSRPVADGEAKPFHGDEEENESVKAWKGEMHRRFRGHEHGLCFHHHHHHERAMEKDDGEHPEQQDKKEDAGDMHVKMFSRDFHRHNHGDEEEQEETAMKHHYFHHHHNHDDEEDQERKHHYFRHHHDGDSEVDDMEELARRLSKAIMRRSFSRGSIRRHHRHHHAEEGGVRKWFKGLMNMHMF